MSIDTMTWNQLSEFDHKRIVVFGTDKNATDMVEFIRSNNMPIDIEFFLKLPSSTHTRHFDLPVLTVAQARTEGLLEGKNILIAHTYPDVALNQLLDDKPAEIRLVSRQLHTLFHSGDVSPSPHAQKKTTPFYIEPGTPQIPALITNAYQTGGPGGECVFEIADFQKQEYVTWHMPSPPCPLSLRDFSKAVSQNMLPMDMSHLSYLLWKRGVHVTQLSPSRRYFMGVRYNWFWLDILDTETNEITRWHDLPPEAGLWDYVATGDFDNDRDDFLFVRWPVADAVEGMRDGSNRVHCQVGRLHLDTMKADILHEFDFQDRIHQCTLSGDGRYMVFAPMRVLRPGGGSGQTDRQTDRQTDVCKEDIMRNLQRTVVLDSMATLDLHTGKVWFTEIPYPIPAHFELDPFDPHLFYVSTHSLMPHAGGVLCFQPGTLHKMRILDGQTIMEGTYTHPGFIRTTQHCVFAWNGTTHIAATNQNKLEIIDATDMRLWHCHKIADDPFYDNADFNDPEFLKKPFNLPPKPSWCDSVSASGDGRWLILHLDDHFSIFDMQDKTIVGNVMYRDPAHRTSHGRYWMQNAPMKYIETSYRAFTER